MADKSISNFGGVNTYTNPFDTKDGNVIHCLNLETATDGSKIKRPGYAAFLGTPDNGTVASLFSWTKDDGTTLFLYRASGSSLYYSIQGTGAWTKAGEGTISNGAAVYGAVLNNTLIVGDGVGSMRYTANGTSFTTIAAAPIGGAYPTEFQGRIYAIGTASNLFYSTTGTASDWTTDSSSLLVGDAGKLGRIFKASNMLMITKTSGLMFRWDGFNLIDNATRLGPSSPYSLRTIEDFWFYLNRLGFYVTNGDKPQLISNAIQRQIYNQNDTGIGSSVFDTAPGATFQYDYLTAVGSVRDDFTDIPINNAVVGYNYKNNEFLNYKYANFPTAFMSFTDVNKTQRLVFGDATGQCYQFGNTLTADVSTGIEASMVIILHGDLPHIRKDFGYIEFFTNPGCQAMVQFSVEDVVTRESSKLSGPRVWKDLCSLTKGYTLVRFPPETRGRIMYLRFYEAGTTRPWELYSLHYTFEPIAL